MHHKYWRTLSLCALSLGWLNWGLPTFANSSFANSSFGDNSFSATERLHQNTAPIVAVLPTKQVFSRALQFLQSADRKVQNQNWQGALTDVNQSLLILNPYSSNDPNYADFMSKIYFQRGLIYEIGFDNHSQAITDFDLAIALTPRKTSEMYYSRALVYVALKSYQNAVNDLDQAIRINPQYANAYKQRGGGHYFLGNISQARTDFATALNLYRQQGNQSEVNRMQRLLQLVNN